MTMTYETIGKHPGIDPLQWSNPKRKFLIRNDKLTPGRGSLRQKVVDTAHELIILESQNAGKFATACKTVVPN
jgi:hypothetical protein